MNSDGRELKELREFKKEQDDFKSNVIQFLSKEICEIVEEALFHLFDLAYIIMQSKMKLNVILKKVAEVLVAASKFLHHM